MGRGFKSHLAQEGDSMLHFVIGLVVGTLLFGGGFFLGLAVGYSRTNYWGVN